MQVCVCIQHQNLALGIGIFFLHAAFSPRISNQSTQSLLISSYYINNLNGLAVKCIEKKIRLDLLFPSSDHLYLLDC